MNTTPADLTVKSIEGVLMEKEAALAKEQAMLEGLKELLGRMGYEIVPIGLGERQRGGRSRPIGVPHASAETAGGRRRGRPPKAPTASAPTGEEVTEQAL
jgi:hypothetical protein